MNRLTTREWTILEPFRELDDDRRGRIYRELLNLSNEQILADQREAVATSVESLGSAEVIPLFRGPQS